MKTNQRLLSLRSAAAFLALLIIGTVMFAGGVHVANADTNRPLGDSRMFARVPMPPGFPEGIAVNGNRVYICGPAVFSSRLRS